MANEAKAQVLTEAEAKALILANVKIVKEKATAAKDDARWSVAMHVSLVRRIMLDLGLPDDAQEDFMAVAKAMPGVFVNSPQWVQHDKELEPLLGKRSEAKKRNMDIY